MSTTLTHALVLAATALGVVLTSMILLFLVLSGLRRLGQPSPRRAAPPAETDTGDEAPGELDGATLAALSAAAFVALGHPVRIHRVHLHRERAHERWGRAGRMDILLSHQRGPNR
ncbi:MAG: hypothetical protein RBU45_22420 [Myxococcota bacterium]|jgi:hypothetical protein|nr:hypothetical protein [Myxococcota bacterium]